MSETIGLTGRIRKILGQHGLNVFGRPTLEGLHAFARAQTTEPLEFVGALLPRYPVDAIGSVLEESAVEVREQDDRLRLVHLVYPENYGCEQVHLRALYAIIRTTRPRVVLETGVANGASTRIILKALQRNGLGALESLDVKANVGKLVEKELRANWTLHIVRKQEVSQALHRLGTSLRPIDVFLHDSDHSYAGQAREYQLALSALSPDGILLSDDIDRSFAFPDLLLRTGLRSINLVGSRKVFGAVSMTLPGSARV